MPHSLFFDLGGVCLTNGWDTAARAAASTSFDLDPDETEHRHDRVSEEFECGRITLDEYLDEVVFHIPRTFSRRDFFDFMKLQSRPFFAPIQVIREIRAHGRYFMGVINNESRDLNRYRIEAFDLGSLFDLFISSCYVGVRKPARAIFRLALEVANRDPADCLLIDDRPENIEVAQDMGFGTLHLEQPELMGRLLRERGIEW